jgi:phenylpyruvate tautomerase PptA (4-oxalocrotonate tautomerase family)
MPFTQVAMRAGKPPAYRRAILDSIYLAMRETFVVPEDDRFMTITEHEPDDILFGRTYMDIPRSDDLVIIQVTASDTRDVATKRAFFKRVSEELSKSPGLRPEDVFINLVEVRPENWSFGHGLAQYATGET